MEAEGRPTRRLALLVLGGMFALSWTVSLCGGHEVDPVAPTNKYGLQPAKCPTPGLSCPLFATTSVVSVTLGGTASGLVTMTYHCPKGFHIVGSETLVCHPTSNVEEDGSAGKWRTNESNTSALVTASPVCAACQSPEFKPSRTGSCYLLQQTDRGHYVNAGDAHRLCLNKTSHLVRIDNQFEQDSIAKFVEAERQANSRIRDILIGLYDKGSNSTDYRWLDQPGRNGSTYRNWARDSPKAGLGAVVMQPSTSDWVSVNTTYHYADYICEQKSIVQCGSPPSIDNSNSTYQNSSTPFTVTYSCNYGYELHGHSVYECSDSGKWTSASGSSVPPVCKPVECSPPHHLESVGIVLRNRRGVFHYGTVIQYSCGEGFRIHHRRNRTRTHIEAGANGYRYASITCLASGDWSDHIVKCEACQCANQYTKSAVCDWVTGECLCNASLHAEGKTCDECADGYFREGTDKSVPCQSCGCGVAAKVGSKCDKRLGNCSCVAGCFGQCHVHQCNLYCGAESDPSLQGVFDWPETGVSASVHLSCPIGISQACNDSEDCLGMATRKCAIANGTAEWGVPEMSACSYRDQLTEQLNGLKSKRISADNVGEIADELSTVARSKAEITTADISITTDVLERVVSVRSSDTKVGQQLLNTVSALANASTDVLANQGADNTTNRLLAVIDDYAATTPLKPGETVRRLNVSGISMTVMDVDPAASAHDGIAVGQAGVDVTLPGDIFANGDLNIKVRVQATVFTESSLFVRRNRSAAESPSSSPITESLDPSLSENEVTDETLTAEETLSRLAIASNILSLSVAEESTDNLTSPVNMRFTQKGNPPAGREPTCVYWNLETSDWATDGCKLVPEKAGENIGEEGTFTCACQHLTHFAILMDFEPDKDSSHTVALQWITYIGLSLSLVGLLMTFVTLGCYPKLRRMQQMKLLLQLCVAWCGAIIAFLIGGQLPDYPSACATFAVFLHYFLLVVFMWTLAQACFLYIQLVLVYTDGVKTYFKRAIIICWSLPVLVVVITVGATKGDAYMPKPDGVNVCVLNIVNAKAAFIGSYLVPICLILAVNIVLFVLVLRRIIKPRPGMKKRQLEDHKRDLKIAVSLAVLLGLTWLTGVGIVGEARIAFSYIFTFLNAFLGFFIFMLHFALRHEVLDEFRRSVKIRTQSLSSNSRSGSTRITKAFMSQESTVSRGGDSNFSVASTTAGGSNGGSGWKPLGAIIAKNPPPACRKPSLESMTSGDSSRSDPNSQGSETPERVSHSPSDEKAPPQLSTILSERDLSGSPSGSPASVGQATPVKTAAEREKTIDSPPEYTAHDCAPPGLVVEAGLTPV